MRDIKQYYDSYYKKNDEYFKNRNKIKGNPEKQAYCREYYKMNKHKKKKQIPRTLSESVNAYALPTVIKFVENIIVCFN